MASTFTFGVDVLYQNSLLNRRLLLALTFTELRRLLLALTFTDLSTFTSFFFFVDVHSSLWLLDSRTAGAASLVPRPFPPPVFDRFLCPFCILEAIKYWEVRTAWAMGTRLRRWRPAISWRRQHTLERSTTLIASRQPFSRTPRASVAIAHVHTLRTGVCICMPSLCYNVPPGVIQR